MPKHSLELESLVAGVCATKNVIGGYSCPLVCNFQRLKKKNITLSKKEKKSPLHRLLYK